MINPNYEKLLKLYDFNEEQIQFINKQYENYQIIRKDEHFYYDSWERDMWYTMNQSGLFEKDEENKSEIYDWDPGDTRRFISEVNF